MPGLIRRVGAVALWLAVGPVAWAGPRCQVERSTDARLRLAVWGRELAGAKGLITARSTRHAAIVQTRGGAVLDALFLVTLQEAGNPAPCVSVPHAMGALHSVGNRLVAQERIVAARVPCAVDSPVPTRPPRTK